MKSFKEFFTEGLFNAVTGTTKAILPKTTGAVTDIANLFKDDPKAKEKANTIKAIIKKRTGKDIVIKGVEKVKDPKNGSTKTLYTVEGHVAPVEVTADAQGKETLTVPKDNLKIELPKDSAEESSTL